MFAAIISSQTAFGERVTAVIPQFNGSAPRVYSRIGQSKGIPWGEVTSPELLMTEPSAVLDSPKVVMMTMNDITAINNGEKPTVLLQKLQREAPSTAEFATTNLAVTFADTLKDVYETAHRNSSELSKYIKHTRVLPSVVNLVPTVVETIAEPVVEAPVFEEVVVEPVVVEPVAIVPNASNEVVVHEEPQMHFSTFKAKLSVPKKVPYFDRVFGGKPEKDILDDARAHEEAVIYTGPAGTGKTSSAIDYAAERGLPIAIIECTQNITDAVTQGRYVATGNGNQVLWAYSELASIIQGPGVVLFNELSRMVPKAAGLFLRVLQERKLTIDTLNEVIDVHPECLLIADQNIGSGYTGVSRQDAALYDRFNFKLEFSYDTKIEEKFIKSKTLLEFATAIRQASEMHDQFSIPMSTRILKNFQAQATRLGFEFAVYSLLNNYPETDGEREALKMRFDAVHHSIAEELGVDVGSYK